MELPDKSLGNNIVKKIVGVEYFFIILGLLMYTDIFLYLTLDINIMSVAFSDIKEKILPYYIFQYLIYLTFLYAIVSKGLVVLLELAILKVNKHIYTNEMKELKNISIINNLSSAYNHYINKLAEVDQYRTLKKIILTDILLFGFSLILVYFYNKENVVGHLVYFYDHNILKMAIDFILIISLIALFVFLVSYPSEEYKISTDIDDYDSLNKKFWLEEISLGLIDREEMFKHLKQLIEYNSLSFIKKEEVNESLKYCEQFELAYFRQDKQTIVLREKGRFFKKYILNNTSSKEVI
ncbi:hypothetical protein [Arcobacter sp.]|uniref:hypothetical protein n=1 Tax=Arcobacter sp. TaxID=1872629 RepID=UPI003D129C65